MRDYDSADRPWVSEYSYIRAVACIAIIVLHTLAAAMGNFSGSLPTEGVVAYRSVQNCVKWAMPSFIMVTGMLLLPPSKEVGYEKLFKKYIWRVVKAIFIFGIIFVVLELVFAKRDPGAGSFFYGIYEVFAGDTWSHMWYLYCLVGLYLLLPVYKMVASKAKEFDMRYLLIVFAVFLSIVPLLNAFGIRVGFYIHTATIYPFWFFMGYYLRRWRLQKSLMFYVITFAATAALLVIFTWLRWTTGNESLDVLFNYASIIVIVNAMSFIGIMHNVDLSGRDLLREFFMEIDKHSFGIYLVHMIIIWLFMGVLGFDPFTWPGVLGVICIAAVTLVGSYYICRYLKLLPVFDKIL